MTDEQYVPSPGCPAVVLLSVVLTALVGCSGGLRSESSPSEGEAECSAMGLPKTLPVSGASPDSLKKMTAAVIPDSLPRVVQDTSPSLSGGLRTLQADIQYPQFASSAGVEGRVYVAFIVGADGHPQNVTVVKTADDRLNQAARRAVQSQRFKPGRLDGTPVCVPMVTTATFRVR